MTRAKGGTTAKVDHSKLLKYILHTFGSIWGKVMQGRSKQSANDSQVGGSHYKNLRQQHWDRMVELFGWPGARPYFVGNVTAYVERYWQKNGVEDLKKAIHYLQKLIELEEGSGLKYRCGCVILPSDKIESFCPKHLVSIAVEKQDTALDHLHYRWTDDTGAVCGVSRVVTTSLPRHVTCPQCLDEIRKSSELKETTNERERVPAEGAEDRGTAASHPRQAQPVGNPGDAPHDGQPRTE